MSWQPPQYRVDAVQQALRLRLAHFGFNLVPAAIHAMAVGAIKADRLALLDVPMGRAHREADSGT